MTGPEQPPDDRRVDGARLLRPAAGDPGVVDQGVQPATALLDQLGRRGDAPVGRTVLVVPDSARSQLHDGLVAVPVVDAPEVTTVIAWPPHSRSRAVADLVRTALRR